MFFLFGERIHSQATAAGERRCGVCRAARAFSRVKETNYFCVFGLRLLPVETFADYLRCETCGMAFALDQRTPADNEAPLLPAFYQPVKQVIAYLLLGFGMRQQVELAREVAEKLGVSRYSTTELNELIKQVDIERLDILETLKARASSLDIGGKQRIIQAAFLVTHACCEMQHEDRLRINLMANALGESLEFVEATIQQARQAGYYGVRRLLPARSTQG